MKKGNLILPTILLLALATGGAVMISWPKAAESADDKKNHASQSGLSHKLTDRSLESSRARTRYSERGEEQSIGQKILNEIQKPITHANLEAWLESKKGNSREYAEALGVAGVLVNDPELIRKGIEIDPGNPLLLFIGASSTDFSDEERLALSKRLLDADPDNLTPVYLSAAYLLKSGQTDAAMAILKSSAGRSKMEDYRSNMMLTTEEALIAAGLSRDAAGIRCISEQRMLHLVDFTNLTKALNGMATTMSPEDSSELKSMTATMSQQFRNSAKTANILELMASLRSEEEGLRGLSDDAPSPYMGLTVGQARESILAERKEIMDILKQMPDTNELLLRDHELAGSYYERMREVGELEALKWLNNELKNKD